MSYSERYAAKLARYRDRLERRSLRAEPRPRPRARRRLAGAALGRCHYLKASNLRCSSYVPKRGRLYCDAHFKAARAAAISRGLKLYHATKKLQAAAGRDRVWSREGSGTDWLPSVAIRYRS